VLRDGGAKQELKKELKRAQREAKELED